MSKINLFKFEIIPNEDIMLLEKTHLDNVLDRVKIKELDTMDIQEEINRVFVGDQEHYNSIGQQLIKGNAREANEFDFDF